MTTEATTTFTLDELGFIQLALNKVLAAVANGEPLYFSAKQSVHRAIATRTPP